MGKTTACRKLLATPEFKDYTFLGSVSSTLHKAKGLDEQSFKALSPEEKIQFQVEVFKAKIAQDRNTERFVADRTLIDHLIYCLILLQGTLSPSQVNELISVTKDHCNQAYDIIFYIPTVGYSPKPDQVRYTDPALIGAFDFASLGFLTHLQGPLIFSVNPELSYPDRDAMIFQILTGEKLGG